MISSSSRGVLSWGSLDSSDTVDSTSSEGFPATSLCTTQRDEHYRNQLRQTFESLKFVRGLPPLATIRPTPVHLCRLPAHTHRKTLVFDLDETLVHCEVAESSSKFHTLVEVESTQGHLLTTGVNIRPFARECLAAASALFEVVVFTAAQQRYADKVLQVLDPTGELIHHKLYRDNCISVKGVLMKDLRILAGRRLQDIVIVDNATHNFGYQLDNGVPILSWFDDPLDTELASLTQYLHILAEADDIREINRVAFRLRTFYEDYLNEFPLFSLN